MQPISLRYVHDLLNRFGGDSFFLKAASRQQRFEFEMKKYFTVIVMLVLAGLESCQECKNTSKCDDNKSTSNNSLEITCS